MKLYDLFSICPESEEDEKSVRHFSIQLLNLH